MIGLIPLSWRIGGAVALVALLFAAHLWRVNAAYNGGHAAAVSERAAADGRAIMARTTENAEIEAAQSKTNRTIEKVKNEEIAKLRTRLAAAERMRKPAFCNEPAGASQAESAGSGNVADPGGGLLSERVEQDIQALILKTEEAAATGRACQKFVRDNGMIP